MIVKKKFGDFLYNDAQRISKYSCYAQGIIIRGNGSYVKSINFISTLKSHHSTEQAATHASKPTQQQRSMWLRETSSPVRKKQRTGNCFHLVSEKAVHGSQFQQLLLEFHGACPGHGEIRLMLINKIL